MTPQRRWLSLPHVLLPARIAAWVVAGLIVVQLANVAVFFALPRPAPRQEQSLAEAAVLIGQVASEAFRLPYDERAAFFDTSPLHDRVTLTVRREMPDGVEQQHGGPPDIERLGQVLVERYAAIKSVRLLPPQHSLIEFFGIPLLGLLPGRRDDGPPRTGRESPASGPADPSLDAGKFMRTPLSMALQGADGTWIVVADKDLAAFTDTLRLVALIPLLAIAGFVGFVLVWAARNEMAPLMRLVAAAEKIGHSQSPVPINVRGNYEVEALSRSLNDMQRRIQTYMNDHTLMLAAISHDLRTPLTRIRLASEYITDNDAKAGVIENIEEMESMIESALAYAEGFVANEAGVPTDIAILIASLVDEANDRGHIVRFIGPQHNVMTCRAKALRRAIGNVLDNACKYGNEVEVLIDAADLKCSVTIKDNGPGIKADDFEAVFAPFHRIPDGSERRGFGLGLTIARDIVTAHGGEILLEPNVPNGLSVTVSLSPILQ